MASTQPDPAPASPGPNPPARARRRWWRRRLVVYPSLSAMFVLFITFGGCADSLLLHPSTDAASTAGATRVVVPVGEAGQGRSVEVWTAPSGPPRTADASISSSGEPEPLAFLLMFGGNNERAEWALVRGREQWGGHPVEVWAVNYPGFGGSSGRATMRAVPPAALAAYDALRRRAGDRPIFVSGLSFGTTAALYLATQRPVAGLVLQNPPPLRQLILQRHGWWNLWLLATPVALQVPSELDSVANAKRVTAPACFVLAGADTLVPPPYQQKVVGAYAGERRSVTLPGVDHNALATGAAADDVRAAVDWMWEKTIGPAPAGREPVPPTTRPAPGPAGS